MVLGKLVLVSEAFPIPELVLSFRSGSNFRFQKRDTKEGHAGQDIIDHPQIVCSPERFEGAKLELDPIPRFEPDETRPALTDRSDKARQVRTRQDK